MAGIFFIQYEAKKQPEGDYRNKVKCRHCNKDIYTNPFIEKKSDGHFKCPYCGREQ